MQYFLFLSNYLIVIYYGIFASDFFVKILSIEACALL